MHNTRSWTHQNLAIMHKFGLFSPASMTPWHILFITEQNTTCVMHTKDWTTGRNDTILIMTIDNRSATYWLLRPTYSLMLMGGNNETVRTAGLFILPICYYLVIYWTPNFNYMCYLELWFRTWFRTSHEVIAVFEIIGGAAFTAFFFPDFPVNLSRPISQ